MCRLVFSPLRNRPFRTLLLFSAVLVVSAAFGLFLSASETTIVEVDQDLARYWRTTYDILVRPPGYRSEVEEQYNLVQPNYLLGIPGGISFAQYKAIRNIPGVEVAAPIAVVGGFEKSLSLLITEVLPPGTYATYCAFTEDDGVRLFREGYGPEFYHIGPDASALSDEELTAKGVSPAWAMPSCAFSVSGLLVGVDPEAEEALVGLSRAVTSGTPLQKVAIPLLPIDEIFPKFPRVSETKLYSVPVLLNVTPYLSFTVSGQVVQLELPSEVQGIRDILSRGGAEFLATLPHGEVVAGNTREGWEAYRERVGAFSEPGGTIWFHPFQGTVPPVWRASPVEYRVLPPFQGWEPVLEAVPREEGFREVTQHSVSPFAWFVVGTFNVEKLGLPEELSAVPLETYFPPRGVLRYDENGDPAPPILIRPTSKPSDYFQSPPLLLTTLEAARAIAGEDCISTIRVRVAGIDRFSPQTQSRIEAIASEIIRRTGLEVDVVVGSSPRPVPVHIPGLGYMEEYWVQKGVTLTTHREVRRADLLLFVALLGVCALFIFNTSATTVVGRVGELGLLKALGWRGRSLAALILTEGLLIGAAGGIVGMGLAGGLAKGLGLVFPAGRALLILPTGILLCLAGFALPAIWAGRVPPVVVIRQGEQAVQARAPRWLGYAGRSLWRRGVQAWLAVGVMAAGAGILTFLLCLLAGMRGYLALTLLGQYILMRVSGYHWGMVGVTVGIGALAVADVLLVEMERRRAEIGVLKAIGWRTGAVMGLFLAEGALLGLAGGLAGTALGLGVYLALYREFGLGLLGAAAAGLAVPVGVGMLAALYPARVAARVPPAEAVRAE